MIQNLRKISFQSEMIDWLSFINFDLLKLKLFQLDEKNVAILRGQLTWIVRDQGKILGLGTLWLQSKP